MSYLTVTQALETRLKTVTTLPTFYEENSRKSLGSGKTSWCRGTLLPSKNDIHSIGNNGYNRLNGLYQVDIFVDSDIKYTSGYNIADAILQKFVPGTVLNNINIKNSWVESGQTVTISEKIPNYWMIPVLIEWEYFVQRPTIT